MTSRPVRDRYTWMSYTQIGLYGSWVYGFGAVQALLRDEQGTSKVLSALHGTTMAIGLIIGSVFAAAVMARLGRGSAMRLGAGIAAVGLIGFTSGLPAVVTLVSAAVVAGGFAIVVTGISAFLSAQQGPAAPAALSEGNGVGALGGLVAAFGVSVTVAIAWGWRPMLWLTVLGLVLLELWRGRSVHAFDIGEKSHVAGRIRELPRLFWWTCVVILPAAGIEFCVALWSADLLRQQGGLGDGAASAAVACAGGGVLVGRLAGARLAQRFNPEWLLAITYAASGVAFMALWSTSLPWLMLVLLVVTGAALAMQWPLSIGRSIRAVAPYLADRAAGTAIVVAGVAIGIAPFALGALYQGLGGDVSALRSAFLIVPAMAILGTVMVVVRPVPMELTLSSGVRAAQPDTRH